MSYLYWYMGIGAGSLLVIYITHRLGKKEDAASANELLAALNPRRHQRWYRIVHDVLIPTLCGVLVIPLWPVLLYMKAQQWLSSESDSPSSANPVFSVALTDLLTQVSRQEIEEREKVTDPLGAVSAQPFGHLHPVWRKFAEGIAPDDTLWTFSSQWTPYGTEQLRTGYVIVRQGKIGPHFLSLIKEVTRD